uniref:RecQ-mediated genome instability protein 1 n=2 Tax=Mesocestoides corti TaxID=53468 RepID=A0A5K3FNB0_MESCO
MVPEGWLEACLEWLVEDQGDRCAQFTPLQWREAVYEQWLHSDLNQLCCPILPDLASGAQETLLLEGELCLQVSAILNIGESYYGQLRKLEGDLDKDLPDLENDPDQVDFEDRSVSLTFQSANASQYSQANRTWGQQPTYALYLTDGITTIKAVELGSKASSSSSLVLEDRYRVGAKVKLRGPLKLRNRVLMLPCGSITCPSASPQSHCVVLGGEVDQDEDRVVKKLTHLQEELLVKLNLPVSAPPDWLPGRRRLAAVSQEAQSTRSPPPPPPPPAPSASVGSRHQNCTVPQSLNATRVAPPPQSPAVAKQASSEGLFETNDDDDVDDLLLACAMENLEAEAVVANADEDQVDAALLNSALQEIDFSPLPDPPPIEVLKRPAAMPPSTEPPRKKTSLKAEVACAKRPHCADIRRFLGDTQKPSHSVPIQSFSYLQDVYYDLQKQSSNQSEVPRKEVYNIRGMLVSLQSRLEHHDGQRWSLTVRLSDGSATVDADMEDDLLKELIGVSAVESEAMRQLGRKGDENQKRRLKEVIDAFQLKLCHLNGLFEIVLAGPPSSAKPRIRRFRALDSHWLSELQKRVL